eukprot:gene12365-biopygen9091
MPCARLSPTGADVTTRISSTEDKAKNFFGYTSAHALSLLIRRGELQAVLACLESPKAMNFTPTTASNADQNTTPHPRDCIGEDRWLARVQQACAECCSGPHREAPNGYGGLVDETVFNRSAFPCGTASAAFWSRTLRTRRRRCR